MKRTTLSCSIAVTVALAACAQTPPDTTEADAATIRGQTESFLAAWNAGDAATLGQLYAEDIVEMQPDGPALEGRAAIVQSFTDFLTEFTATQTAEVDEVDVQGDLAFSRGRWQVRQTPRTGGDEEVRSGKWMVLYQRQTDGSWKMWRWMWNQDSTTDTL